ncbi:MAG TPA: response regulator [Gaiellaceae bacterium]|nr:response regulator [Gaiellaceae bacterium]
MTEQRPLVVVADDEKDILLLVATVLRNAGFDVIGARDGAEALMEIRFRRPQLAILDLSMPELDGLEVLRRIRADPDLAKLPIVILSARAQEADVALGYAEGASKYVRKPFKPRELAALALELVQSAPEGR